MRIIAGGLRGRTLVAPKGHSTRPTADRARQALFDVLEHAAWSPGLSGRRVIDLFAGSGALGLESASRGAAFCLFIDRDTTAIEAIEGNIRTLKLEQRARAARRDATRIGPLSPADGPAFDLAFLDPPYGTGLTEPALAALTAGGWLAAGATVVAERGAEETPLQALGYEFLDMRAWGAARVDFLRRLG